MQLHCMEADFGCYSAHFIARRVDKYAYGADEWRQLGDNEPGSFRCHLTRAIGEYEPYRICPCLCRSKSVGGAGNAAYLDSGSPGTHEGRL